MRREGNTVVIPRRDDGRRRSDFSRRLSVHIRLLAPVVTFSLIALQTPAGAQDTAYRHRPIERVRDPLVGRADLGGRVYEDRSSEGISPADSPGIAGVVVSLDDGRYAVTKDSGWWHMSEVSPGQRVVTLRRQTLPPGAVVAASRSIGEVPPGTFVRVDFPVSFELETIRLGQVEILGYRIFPRVEDLPANIVGNATDIQALVNGVRVNFPRADVEMQGLAAGGFVPPGAFRRVAFRLEEEADLNPSEWRLSVVTADGSTKRVIRGDGEPPRRLDFDGRDDQGEVLPGPAAYAVRLCVDYGPNVAACSPYRPFGVIGMEGRNQVQPMLELPRAEAAALVNGEPATLDEDGSFILPVRLDAERVVLLDLSRDDGRHAQARVQMPTLEVTDPAEDFGVEWGKSTDLYRAPEAPGTVTLRISGSAEPTGSRLQLGREPVPVSDGRWQTEIEVPLGQSRFELLLTDPRGFNILHELHFHLAERSPQGDPLVVQPRIPDLELHLPQESAESARDEVRVRGRAAKDARVTINGAPVQADEAGEFDLLANLDESGAVEVVAADDEGRQAIIRRAWQRRGAALATSTWVDGEPFLRLIHGELPEDESSLRMGLGGVARFNVHRLEWQGLNLFAGLSAGPNDRLSGSNGAPARAGLYGGAEARFGRRFAAGARYEGAAFVGGDETLMRHDAALTAMLVGDAFDVLFDTGYDSGVPGVEDAGPLAGAGLGFRLRAGQSLQVRARAGALIALTGSDGDLPEILDASAQVSYQPPGPMAPTVTLRYAHIEDNRLVHPEAAGDVVHLALAWPIHDQVRLLQTVGGWLAGAGSVTALNITRVELSPTPAALVALDYRLLTQLDRHEHVASIEGAYRLLDWLRLGGLYQFSNTSDTDETSSRLQARLQATF